MQSIKLGNSARNSVYCGQCWSQTYTLDIRSRRCENYTTMCSSCNEQKISFVQSCNAAKYTRRNWYSTKEADVIKNVILLYYVHEFCCILQIFVWIAKYKKQRQRTVER